MLAPILSFTAEEVFSYLPKNKAVKDTASVHLLEWNSVPDVWNDPKIDDQFKILLELRPFVLKALEEKRREGMIGSALEAKLVFKTASERIFKYLQDNKKDLPAMFVVSQIDVARTDHIEKMLGGDFHNTEVAVEKAEGAKCERCWNYKLDVGQEMDHPTLCARCTGIVRAIRL